ncbi:MAG: hypothetical protein GC137_00855 [Alphaproteobacteria bacterium]|nr:hypothetical protein [Alphaproteobacteria bacterium]
MTLRNGHNDQSHPRFLVKTFGAVHDGESAVLKDVEATAHIRNVPTISVSQIFDWVRRRPSGDFDVFSAYEWSGKRETDAPVLIAQQMGGAPRVIGKRVLNTDKVEKAGYVREMSAGRGRTSIYFVPRISNEARDALAANIHNPAVVDRVVRLLETPDAENDSGRKSSIDVFECMIGSHRLYALKYTNTLNTGSGLSDYSSHTDHFLNFYNERGQCLTIDQLQDLLKEADSMASRHDNRATLEV